MTPIDSAHAFAKPAPFVPTSFAYLDPVEVNLPLTMERAGFLLNGTQPPLPPHNFHEAAPGTSFRPTTAITLAGCTPPPVTACGPDDIAPSPCDAEPTAERTTTNVKTARPVSRKQQWLLERQAKEIHCRLDNLHLRLENYSEAYPDEVLSWWNPRCGSSTTTGDAGKPSPALKTAPETKKGRGRPKKIEVNRIKPYLQNFMFASEALSELPMFDDIVSGTVIADAGGNTRPFSKKRMVRFLQNLDIISTAAIQKEMNCSLRHAQKVAMCLRIIERHAFHVARKHWHLPTGADWVGID